MIEKELHEDIQKSDDWLQQQEHKKILPPTTFSIIYNFIHVIIFFISIT